MLFNMVSKFEKITDLVKLRQKLSENISTPKKFEKLANFTIN